MRSGTDGKLRHDGNRLQNIITERGMGLNLHKLVVFEFALFLQHLVLNADLADIVQQGDVMVFFDLFLVASKLFSEHLRIFCHAEGMTSRIAVLHIDCFSECFNHLVNEGFLFRFLCFQLMNPASYEEEYHSGNQQDTDCDCDCLEPPVFIEHLILDDTYRKRFNARTVRVADFHMERVSLSVQVGVRDRCQVRAADGRLSTVKALKPVGYLRIGERIRKHIRADGYRLYIGFNPDQTALIRVNRYAVCEDKRHGHLQVRNIIKVRLDVHHRYAFAAGNIEGSVGLQLTVGVGSRHVRKTVIPVIEMRINLFVSKQFRSRNDIYAVTA